MAAPAGRDAGAADRPLLGVGLMVGFCILAPMGDATAKMLGALPLAQAMLARYGIQAVLLAPISGRGVAALDARLWRMTAVRTVLHVASFTAFFASLRFLPMADAVAICFVLPFVLLLLARVLLGEAVGPQRLAACAVGFVGTLMVVQPSFAEVGAPALLPLVAALLFAAFMLVTRTVARAADPIVLQAASGVVATVGLAALVATGAVFGWDEIAPVTLGPREAGLLALLGVFGTSAHLAMAWALRFAPSATLAPVQYLEIPFATLVGYLVFGEFPNGLAALGIVVTVASGLYVVYREHRASRAVPG